MSQLDWDDPNRGSSSRQKMQPGECERRYNRNDGHKGKKEKKLYKNFRSNDHKYEEKIDVPYDCVGRLIGRKGSNVKALQRQFDVLIDIDSNNLLAIVKGSSKSVVDNAITAIRAQFKDTQTSSSQDGINQNAEVNLANLNKSTEELRPKSPLSSHLIDVERDNQQSEEARMMKWENLLPITKNFYIEHVEVTQLSPSEVEAIRKNNNDTQVSLVLEQYEKAQGDKIKIFANDIPNPVKKFQHCFEPFPDLLIEIENKGFERPTPIQAQAWPILLKGYDMIGIAQTGTGKTLAFLLPAMVHTEFQPTPRAERNGPNVLVLAPTRELALQIEAEVNKYSYRAMRAACIYGGGDRDEQISKIELGAEIIICTPGRLCDLMQANVIELSSVTFLVLDEADRMLDMGFEEELSKILLEVRPDRQTVMTSATWPPNVRRLAQRYMNSPIQICIGSLDLTATHSVQQIVRVVTEDDKYRQVRRFIMDMKPEEKAILFCSQKVRVDDLSSELESEGIKSQSIHGERDQRNREQAIADIKSGCINVLVATDVASRGLDIKDITHVINFDFPRNIEEYVHRVGRTGRAGRQGVSITFFTRDDWAQAENLIAILKEANQNVPKELEDMAQSFAAAKEQRGKKTSHRGRGRYR